MSEKTPAPVKHSPSTEASSHYARTYDPNWFQNAIPQIGKRLGIGQIETASVHDLRDMDWWSKTLSSVLEFSVEVRHLRAKEYLDWVREVTGAEPEDKHREFAEVIRRKAGAWTYRLLGPHAKGDFDRPFFDRFDHLMVDALYTALVTLEERGVSLGWVRAEDRIALRTRGMQPSSKGMQSV